MVIRVVVKYWELVKVALKSGGVWKKDWVCGLRVMVVAVLCGPCECLGVFLL
jgi:hypothetical protein